VVRSRVPGVNLAAEEEFGQEGAHIAGVPDGKRGE
jgi:hypothetical protein